MESKLKDIVVRGLAFVLICAGAYVFVKIGFPVILPFALSYVISAGIRPLSSFFSKKTKISKKIWSVILIILTVGIISLSLWFLGSTLIKEAKEALKGIGDFLSDEEGPVKQMSDKMKGIVDKLSIAGGNVEKDMRGMIGQALSALTASFATAVGGFVTGAPSFVFFVVVMILSLFYFSCDLSGIKKELCRTLPKKATDALREWSEMGMRALARFLKAYISLLGITFGALCLGFLIIGTDYPFLAAVLTSLVDILPVFGVGTVLVPWSVILFITGKTTKGIGMLILFAVIYALRQILEPRIVGSAAGVHPIVALFFVFFGFKLFGVAGMIIAPILLNAAAVFWEEKKKKTSRRS